MSEENSSASTPCPVQEKPNQTSFGAGSHQPALPQRGKGKDRLPPVVKAFKPPQNVEEKVPKPVVNWSDQVDQVEQSVIELDRHIRSATSSATDLVSKNPMDFNIAAANAAAEAERLRHQAEKASRDAEILRQLADANDNIIQDDIKLVREYSEPSVGTTQGMSPLEFATIIANLEQMSQKQLKILSSAVRVLIEGEQPEPSCGPRTLESGQALNGTLTNKPISKTNNDLVPVNQQVRQQSRGRSNSRIRANPVQGGVRVNAKGGKIDYDNRIYVDPSGKRYRMQMPRPKSATRLKAESTVQTIIRRIKAFADANGINNQCQPREGSDLDVTYKGLLAELSEAKLNLKKVKDKENPKQ